MQLFYHSITEKKIMGIVQLSFIIKTYGATTLTGFFNQDTISKYVALGQS